MEHKIKNSTFGETIIIKADNTKIYIYELTKGANYKKMHNAVKQIMQNQLNEMFDYNLELYTACKGNIKMINKVLNLVKNIEPSINHYHNLREKLKLSEVNLSNSCIESFMVNPFKIILK